MSQPLRVGIAGLGTVGRNVLRSLEHNKTLINARARRQIEVVAVSAQERLKDRGISLDQYIWYDKPLSMASDPNIDVVVELIGGAKGIAYNLINEALANGKQVVTANKALLALHGLEMASVAEKYNKVILFEAAVAGGIPIIKALREGLAGNQINEIIGILNGTSNYILSSMTDSGSTFEEILIEAQQKGYAESDPSFDVDGIDAAHKLALLASLAFGTKLDFKSVHIEGVRDLSPVDIGFAKALGYGIKLLGVAKRHPSGIEQRVHPCLVPIESTLNHVSGVLNGILVDSKEAGVTAYEGEGAGGGPTASAIIADLIDLARGAVVPIFGVELKGLTSSKTLPMSDYVGPYYVRLMVLDKPGVFAAVANSFKDHNVSMESVLQQARDPGEPVPVVMTVHETQEKAMQKCLSDIEKVEEIIEPPTMIRIENFSV